MPDIRAENHGSIWLLRTPTDEGRDWLNENVEVQQHFGHAAVVEWRYVKPIIDGARDSGLHVVVDDEPLWHSV